ncbi:M23 family metallopeptidase [Ancylobacter mangrovi]|uniref:M23 family metallopeptidase n=1 Tax=Ancylobacter mangrovi TaxID=2972472 RepID=UPI002161E55F|nr:M23 family metallopeptidase [Ancylobacter mangrovi]MCS0501022.1 M23 family metallopeptidase [Ancylobacter mangrovi]
MRPRHWKAVGLGDDPPLNDGEDLPDRRAIGLRWMSSTVLMGVAAAALLVGALAGAVGRRSQLAEPPVFIAPRFARQTVAKRSRADRENRHRDQREGARSRVRVEQLGDSGSMRPFIRVSARLAEIDPDPPDDEDRKEEDRKEDDQQEEPQASAGGGRPQADPARRPELPPIILYGSSQPAPRRHVTAFADDEAPRPGARILGEPVNLSVVPELPASPKPERRVIVARDGDTLAAILTALGVPPADRDAVLAAFPRRHWFGKESFAGGETITLVERPEGPSPGSPIEVSVTRPDGDVTIVARTDAGGYAQVSPEQDDASPPDTASAPAALDLHAFTGEALRDGLDALAKSNHVDDGLVAEIMRLCDRDFDLDQPLGSTDTADILYAPNALGQPELVFLALSAQGKTRRYYRFTAPDDGSTDFYDEDGHSITKLLLRKPVADGRLGDGFGWRTHPVLHDRRFHEGVDYAAPYGSPVAAAGAGVVEIIGKEWGYGKYIRIRHDLGYETAYAHVSGFPRGLKVGDRVRQGQTIAYVGSTGLSTGPHLYYEVWINGRRVNPLKVRLPGGRMLDGKVLSKFQDEEQRIDELLDVPVGVAAGP